MACLEGAARDWETRMSHFITTVKHSEHVAIVWSATEADDHSSASVYSVFNFYSVFNCASH